MHRSTICAVSRWLSQSESAQAEKVGNARLEAVVVGFKAGFVEIGGVGSGLCEPVDRGEVIRGQLHIEGSKVVFELFHGARADDRCGYSGLGGNPGQ